MSPLLSAITLPCSDESSSASAFMSRSIRRLNSNITRARRWGLTSRQAACAALEFSMAAFISSTVASCTRACSAPVLGLNTGANRPDVPRTLAPLMK